MIYPRLSDFKTNMYVIHCDVDIFNRSMNQKHIVKFFSYFEDSENVYMILELCRKKVGT